MTKTLPETSRTACPFSFCFRQCYILRGNYHVSIERLCIELSLAATGGCSVELTKELLAEAAKLQASLSTWREAEEGRPPRERHLFHAAYTKSLTKLTFKELREATTGNAAVPLIVEELLDKHDGDGAQLGVMKLATLIRWLGGTPGAAHNDRHAEIAENWEELRKTGGSLHQSLETDVATLLSARLLVRRRSTMGAVQLRGPLLLLQLQRPPLQRML